MTITTKYDCFSNTHAPDRRNTLLKSRMFYCKLAILLQQMGWLNYNRIIYV